jgi:hypothetical protein
MSIETRRFRMEFQHALPNYGNCVTNGSPVMARAGLIESSDRPSQAAQLLSGGKYGMERS